MSKYYIGEKDLLEGEEICSKCNGHKFMPYPENFAGYELCDHCFGKGKLDWITNIVGEKIISMYEITYTNEVASNCSIGNINEIKEMLADKIAKKIDDEILKSLKGESLENESSR